MGGRGHWSVGGTPPFRGEEGIPPTWKQHATPKSLYSPTKRCPTQPGLTKNARIQTTLDHQNMGIKAGWNGQPSTIRAG